MQPKAEATMFELTWMSRVPGEGRRRAMGTIAGRMTVAGDKTLVLLRDIHTSEIHNVLLKDILEGDTYAFYVAFDAMGQLLS